MKKYLKRAIVIWLFLLLLIPISNAQKPLHNLNDKHDSLAPRIGTLTNTKNSFIIEGSAGVGLSNPDSTAKLDISSFNKGIMIPRIDFDDRPQLATPGLLIFVTANGPYGNNTFYYFNGDGWVRMLTSYYIGQSYGGGKIFWLDEEGQHGLIAAENNAGDYPWGCMVDYIWDLESGIGMGEKNTNTVELHYQELEHYNGGHCWYDFFNNFDSLAARICYHSTLNGFFDWFLPSKDELNQLYLNKSKFGIFNSIPYWSSTICEDSDPCSGGDAAWTQNFLTGIQLNMNRHFENSVRCIRRF